LPVFNLTNIEDRDKPLFMSSRTKKGKVARMHTRRKLKRAVRTLPGTPHENGASGVFLCSEGARKFPVAIRQEA